MSKKREREFWQWGKREETIAMEKKESFGEREREFWERGEKGAMARERERILT